MDRHVLDEALAHDPNPPAVAHGVSILAAASHGAYRIAMLKSSAVLDLYTELRTLAAALNAADIPYGLAGGLAVSLYTTPRATEDIDVLVAAADVDRVVHVAAPLGFRKSGRRIRRANGRIEIQRLVKIDGADLLPLDLMVIVDPGLRDAVQGRTEKVIEDQRLSVVSVDALVVGASGQGMQHNAGIIGQVREQKPHDEALVVAELRVIGAELVDLVLKVGQSGRPESKLCASCHTDRLTFLSAEWRT